MFSIEKNLSKANRVQEAAVLLVGYVSWPPPAASTIMKPSCIKKITAVAAKIQLELAPVLISSRILS